MDPIHRIYWIASYPKSGNTWVRLFLQNYLYGNDDINADLITDDLPNHHYAALSSKTASARTMDEAALMRPAMLLRMIHERADYLYLKTHHAKAKIHIPLIPDPLTAGAVYLVRDPRDVLLSWSRHLCEPLEDTLVRMKDVNCIGIKHGARLWHLLASWDHHVDSWLQSGHLVMKYEDLVADPAKSFYKILPAMGVEDVDAKRFYAALENTKLTELRKQEDAKGFQEKQHQDRFFGKGGSRWRQELPEDLAGRVVDAFGETMETLGYEMQVHVNA